MEKSDGIFKKKRRTNRQRTGTKLEQIHALAWGEIGLTPYQYYCLTPYEFTCILKGWRKRRAFEAALLRKQTQLIYGMVGGKENFLRFWPIEELDGDANKGALTRKKAEAIFKKAKILESQLN